MKYLSPGVHMLRLHIMLDCELSIREVAVRTPCLAHTCSSFLGLRLDIGLEFAIGLSSSSCSLRWVYNNFL
jgi:hypothetical protein